MERHPSEAVSALTGKSAPSLFLLHGPDAYTQNSLISRILATLLPNEKDRIFGVEKLEAPEVTPSHLLGVLKTTPFGLNRKLVILRGFDLVSSSVKGEEKKKGQSVPKGLTSLEEALIRYFNRPSPKTVLVISSLREIRRSSPFYRALPDHAVVVPCVGFREREAFTFVRNRIAARGKKATELWMEQFVGMCGLDARKLSEELEKVFLASGEREALLEEDLAIVSPSEFSKDVFNLLDAILHGNVGDALEVIREMLESGEPPLRILSVLVWHYRLVSKAHRILHQGGNKRAALTVHPSKFVSQKVISHAKRISLPALREIFQTLKESDLLLKGSRLPPLHIMETLVFTLSAAKKTLSAGRKNPGRG